MSIWFNPPSLDQSNQKSPGTALEALGIEFTEIGDDYLTATMPVDNRTCQPFGLLHGGASVLLAESLGSTAANLCVDTDKFYCVGLEINANHLKAAKVGDVVTGITRCVHLGRSTQVWEIKISNQAGQLCCISRITMAVVARR